MPKRDDTKNPDVKKVLEAARLSFDYCTNNINANGSPFKRAERSAMAYERVLDPANWQTSSEIYLPYALSAVEQALASSMQQLFADEDNIFDLVPRGEQIDHQTVRNVKDYLVYVLRSEMNMWRQGYKFVKDAFKLGVGYGMIDYDYITPFRFNDIHLREGNLTIRRLMREYEPELKMNMRYLSFSQVMPSPGGGESVDDRDWVIVIDYIDEQKLRMMHADEESAVGGDIDKIIKEARENRLDAYHSNPVHLIRGLTREGRVWQNQQNSPNTKYYKLPVKVPVIKYFGKDEEIWVANGTTKLYKIDSGPQLLHKPLIKATMRLDGEEWFADGIISANEDIFDATNIMTNVIMDVVDFNSRPRLIRDNRLGEINMEPWGQTKYSGPMDQAPFHQVTVGGVNEEVAYMMNRLDHARQIGNHQPDAMAGNPQAGIMRGGAGAVESLLQNVGVTQQVTSRLLELSFVEDTVVKTLFLLSTMDDKDERNFESTQGHASDGTREWKVRTITRRELQHDFRIEVMTSEKYQNQIAEYQKRLNIITAGINNDPMLARMVLPERKLEYLLGSKQIAQWLTAGANPEAYDMALARLQAISSVAGNAGGGQTSGSGGAGPASGAGPIDRGQLGGGGGGDQAQQAQAGGLRA